MLHVGARLLQVAVSGVEGHVGVRGLEHAAGGPLRLPRGLPAADGVQEPPAERGHGQEVQVEVDGVVQVAQHVDELLGEVVLEQLVGVGCGGALPVVGDEVEDAVREHEGQEDDGDDDKHGGDLLLVPHAPRRLVKVVGQLPLGLG